MLIVGIRNLFYAFNTETSPSLFSDNKLPLKLKKNLYLYL